MEAAPPDHSRTSTLVRELMERHRLTNVELARAAGISPSSVDRLRRPAGPQNVPRARTLRRIADALGELARMDADEIYHELLVATGQRRGAQQGALAVRGMAELSHLYHDMAPTGRKILLQQARILARELPADSSA